MSNLDISTTYEEQATIVRLNGSADMKEANILSQHLEKVFKERNYKLVIDLSGLNFTSSMGLGSLIQAHTTCKENQGHLVVVNPQPEILKILQTTQLDRLFHIYQSLEEAMKVFSEG